MQKGTCDEDIGLKPHSKGERLSGPKDVESIKNEVERRTAQSKKQERK